MAFLRAEHTDDPAQQEPPLGPIACKTQSLIVIYKACTIGFGQVSKNESLRTSLSWPTTNSTWDKFEIPRNANQGSHLATHPVPACSIYQHGDEISVLHSPQGFSVDSTKVTVYGPGSP